MPTECNPSLFDFARVDGRDVVASFDGGRITSDAGALLLGATEVGQEAEADLSGQPALAINSAIYPSLTAAQDAVRNAAPLAAGSPAGTIRFAYFRSYAGVIMPTVFSDVTAPRTIATARGTMAELGRAVSDELVAVAVSIIGTRVISSVYTRVVRALDRWGGTPVRSPQIEREESQAAAARRSSGRMRPAATDPTPPARPAGTSATEPVQGPGAITPPAGAVGASTEAAALRGRSIGETVRLMRTGKRAGIAQQVTAARLSQLDAATATGEASRVAFGRIGSNVRLPNGDLVVPSVQTGPAQPIFVIESNGSVLPARATITITQPVSLTEPITITDIITE